MIEGLHAGHSITGGNGDVDQVVYQSCGEKLHDDGSNVAVMSKQTT